MRIVNRISQEYNEIIRNNVMKNNTKYLAVLLLGTFSFFILLAIASQTDITPTRNFGSESNYSLTINASSGPTGLNSSPQSGSYLGPKDVIFNYANVKNSETALFALENNLSSTFSNTNQITSIKSYQVVFSGDCSIGFGWEYGQYELYYNQGTYLQSGVTYSVDNDYYYFVLGSHYGTVDITSITITYSCVQTPPAPTYTLNPDGFSYAVTGYSKKPYNIIIPSTYNGLPVTRIGTSAFAGAITLETLYIPDSVTEIGDFAFQATDHLSSIRIPDGLTMLPNYAFSGSGISSITLPNSLTTIGSYAFDSSHLTSLSIPSSVTSIGIGALSSTQFLETVTFVEPIGITNISDGLFMGTGLLSLTIPEEITSIGSNAFYFSQLETIVLPSTLTSIGDSAFSYSMQLNNVTGNLSGITHVGANAFEETGWLNNQLSLNQIAILDGRIAVRGRSSLSGAIAIPETIEYIADGAFYQIPNMISVTLPSSLLSIGYQAFYGDTNLTTVNMTSATNLLVIGGQSFYNCSSLNTMSIPASVLDVGDDAFYMTPWRAARVGPGILFIINDRIVVNAQVSGAITLPTTITRIHKEAFIYTAIESITLPEGLEIIGDSAFQQCYSLTSITIPNSVTYLGKEAFFNAGLQSVTMGSGLTAIQDYAFYGNNLLTSITLPSTLTHINDSAFRNCYNLVTLSLPSTLTHINLYAFSSCSSLNSISIPGSVTHISENAFSLSGLTSVTLNEGVRSIGDYAFKDCAALTSVYLPSTLREIGNSAFDSCETLPSIIIPLNVAWIGSSAFNQCPLLTINAVAPSLPSTWDLAWNSSENTVNWGYII